MGAVCLYMARQCYSDQRQCQKLALLMSIVMGKLQGAREVRTRGPQLRGRSGCPVSFQVNHIHTVNWTKRLCFFIRENCYLVRFVLRVYSRKNNDGLQRAGSVLKCNLNCNETEILHAQCKRNSCWSDKT